MRNVTSPDKPGTIRGQTTSRRPPPRNGGRPNKLAPIPLSTALRSLPSFHETAERPACPWIINLFAAWVASECPDRGRRSKLYSLVEWRRREE